MVKVSTIASQVGQACCNVRLGHTWSCSTDEGRLGCLQRNRIGLKGPMATPIGKGHRSLNLTLRKELQVSKQSDACGLRWHAI